MCLNVSVDELRWTAGVCECVSPYFTASQSAFVVSACLSVLLFVRVGMCVSVFVCVCARPHVFARVPFSFSNSPLMSFRHLSW